MRLIYVYDALCGWCYGFSGIITEFVKNHPELKEVEVISGGMVRGDRVGPISKMADYLSKAYKDVEDKTGVKFGDAFLNGTLKEGTMILNSMPAAIAMNIFKEENNEDQLKYASGIQKAIYYDGQKPEDPELYSELASDFGFDMDSFEAKMEDAKYRSLAEQDFAICQQWGVNGFPTVVLDLGDQLVLMARGAASLEMLEDNYKQILESPEA